MRDKKRIKRICTLIEKLWNTQQDQRLGQLLANYVFGHHQDIYFQEDDISETNLSNMITDIGDEMVKKIKKGG